MDLGAEIVLFAPLRSTIKKKKINNISPPKLAGLAEGERIGFCPAEGRAPKVNPGWSLAPGTSPGPRALAVLGRRKVGDGDLKVVEVISSFSCTSPLPLNCLQ